MMLKSSICDYSDACILVSGNVKLTGEGADDAAKQTDERDKEVIFNIFVPFTKCKSEINNAQVDDAKEIGVVTPRYNLIEYSDNHSKISGSVWRYYRDEPNSTLTDSESFKSNVKITRKSPGNGNTKDVKIAVPLKYFSNFWRTLKILLINCEINLILTCSSTFVITNSTGEGTFAITDTKHYVPVVTLSIQDNAKLLEQLKSGFKRTVNWNRYLAKKSIERQNPYSNYLIDPSFQGVNRLFVLLFENESDREAHAGYYLPKVEIKDYNVMIDGKNLFDHPVKNDLRTYENVQTIATGQGDACTTGCLLNYFKEHYKLITINLSKQQALDADPKAIQPINFTGNLEQTKVATVFFIIEEAKKKAF